MCGNSGQYFECGHQHSAGDPCILFGYAPQHSERVPRDAVSWRSLPPPYDRITSVPAFPSAECLLVLVGFTLPKSTSTG
jgi:hypothetical protein